MTSRLQRHGLSMMEWALLGYIHDSEGGARTGRLAKLFDVEASLLTNMINNLETRGFVDRHDDPTDRRAKRIVLTAKSRRLVDTVENQLHDEMERWLQGIDRIKYGTYLEVLNALAVSETET